MNYQYVKKDGSVGTVTGTLYQIKETTASRNDQFDPYPLQTRPRGGTAGQTVWVWLNPDDKALIDSLNPTPELQKWLYVHTVNGWIYFYKNGELVWPRIGLLWGKVLIDRIQGAYGHVVGLPADALKDPYLINKSKTDFWIQRITCGIGGKNDTPRGVGYMPLLSANDRRSKGGNDLWIKMSALKLVNGHLPPTTVQVDGVTAWRGLLVHKDPILNSEVIGSSFWWDGRLTITDVQYEGTTVFGYAQEKGGWIALYSNNIYYTDWR